ncbi:MAG: hypothetical protein U1G07_18760 [Verrucomicrobiota bacterium]
MKIAACPAVVGITALALATIAQALDQPVITLQPADQVVGTGGTATFRVAVSGLAPFAYQWLFNEAELANRTNRNLVLANVLPINLGSYSVRVSNAMGNVTSSIARLMFAEVPAIKGAGIDLDGSFSLSFKALVPTAFSPYFDFYLLEASENLRDWAPLTMLEGINDRFAAVTYRDSKAKSLDQRFYRMPTNFLITPFPKTSGPYAVGTRSWPLTDPSRTDRNNIRSNSSFMVTCWYPAEAQGGLLPEPWLEPKLIAIEPGYWSSKPMSVSTQLLSRAFPGLPLATNQIRYPVLIYSSTWSGRRGNTDKALELASHGYVVVAVDHLAVMASVFPNGKVVNGISLDPGPDLQRRFMRHFTNAIMDLGVVTEELVRLDQQDPIFGGRLDLERFGAFGFSFGSIAAAEFCRTHSRCKAVVILDSGYLLEAATNLTRVGLQKPFLSMNSTGGWIEPSPGFGGWLDAPYALFTNSIGNAYWFQLENSTHQSFSDRGSVLNDSTVSRDPTIVSRAHSQTIRACTLSFFNKYLKGEDDHLLDNPAVVYPNIINFQKR